MKAIDYSKVLFHAILVFVLLMVLSWNPVLANNSSDLKSNEGLDEVVNTDRPKHQPKHNMLITQEELERFLQMEAHRFYRHSYTEKKGSLNQISSYGLYYVLDKNTAYDSPTVLWYFKGLPYAITNESFVDESGNLLICNIYQMDYNEDQQLVEYWWDIKNEWLLRVQGGHLWGAQYYTAEDEAAIPRHRENTLGSYEQISMDELNKVIKTERTNIEYYTEDDEDSNSSHFAGQMAAYEEETYSSESQQVQHVIFQDAEYEMCFSPSPPNDLLLTKDQECLLKSYTKTIEEKGDVTRVEWSGQYNDDGRLLEYNEKGINDQEHITYEIHVENMTYDQDGNLISFMKTRVDYDDDGAYNTVTVITRQETEYNETGQLAGYTETTTATGVETENSAYYGTTKDEYTIIMGKALIKISHSEYTYYDSGYWEEINGEFVFVWGEETETQTKKIIYTYDKYGNLISKDEED